MEKIRPKPNTTNARIRQSKEIASTRLPAIDGISYLADCHYTLIALVSVVFCVLLYAANKRSLAQNKHKKSKARFSRLLRHPAWKRSGSILKAPKSKIE